jgi:hypothetical protein
MTGEPQSTLCRPHIRQHLVCCPAKCIAIVSRARGVPMTETWAQAPTGSGVHDPSFQRVWKTQAVNA